VGREYVERIDGERVSGKRGDVVRGDGTCM
jgi:hypothetical protein